MGTRAHNSRGTNGAIDAIRGEARWSPDASQAGSHPVEVVVEDAFGDGSALRFDVTVQVDGSPAAAR